MYLHHLKSTSIKSITGILLTGLLCCTLTSNLAYAGSTWSRATGEAKDLQRTTKDLRNRLSRLYVHSPATRFAVAIDEMAVNLIERTRNETPVAVLEAELTYLSQTYDQLRLVIASDRAIAGDRNVAKYTADIGKRFNALVEDLRRARPTSRSYIPSPIIYPQQSLTPCGIQSPSIHQGRMFHLHISPSLPSIQGPRMNLDLAQPGLSL